MNKFSVKELPYAYDALEPQMSEETLHFHHDKHYAGYVNKLNELIEGTEFEGKSLEEIILSAQGAIFNNAAQAWNHEFFFAQFSAAPKAAEGKLAEALVQEFGSIGDFQQKLNAAAAGQFGSGWAWLSLDAENRLVITAESNAGNPMCKGLRPIMCFDVWEHAYYVDYHNRRPDAMAAWWKNVDWSVLENRFQNL